MPKKITAFIVSFIMCISFFAVPAMAKDSLSCEFDYSNLTLKLEGNIGTESGNSGECYIVSEGEDIDSLSDSNKPLYMQRIITNSNGRFLADVSFFEEGTEFTYGTYDVYIYSRYLSSPLKASFSYLSPEEIEENKKNDILEQFKNAKTWSGLKMVINGENEEGKVVNDNYAYIEPDTEYYDKLTDKSKLYIELFNQRKSADEFDDIKDMFYSISKKLYEEQEKAKKESGGGNGGGSTGSGGFGPTTSVMKSDPVASNNEETQTKDGFIDIDGHWASKYINILKDKNIINGYEDNTFRPENAITRAEFVKIVTGAFGLNGGGDSGFADVSRDDWFNSSVCAGVGVGIITGFDGFFNPDDYIIRQDAALIIYRAISLSIKLGMGYEFFADEGDIDFYASEAVSGLAEIHIVTGDSSNKFLPKNNITRAETAAIIARTLDYIEAH